MYIGYDNDFLGFLLRKGRKFNVFDRGAYSSIFPPPHGMGGKKIKQISKAKQEKKEEKRKERKEKKGRRKGKGKRGKREKKEGREEKKEGREEKKEVIVYHAF